MFDDWTAQPGPVVSGILRVYTTTHIDEVTGSRLDVTSVPSFVARTRIQSISALPSRHAPPTDAGPAELGEFMADLRTLATGVLGAEARPCATVGDDRLEDLHSRNEELVLEAEIAELERRKLESTSSTRAAE